MNLAPYRHVLSLPGVRSLLLVGVVARIPATAVAMSLTLYVANTLGRSWAQAGLVTAAFTIGAALGAPLIGRLMDRRGMRTVMTLTSLVGGAIWLVVPQLPYVALVPAAVLGGFFGVPIFSAVRVALAALIPADQRRPAFALDSMIVELSYMVGPAVAVVLAITLPGGWGLYAVAFGLTGAGALLWALNPPTHPAGQAIPAAAPPRRTWFGPRLVALMIAGAGATFVLTATDLTIVATLRDAGAVRWTGLAIAIWCAYSLIGGLMYGAFHRPISVLVLVGGLGLLTIPVGLAPDWHWLLIALIPSGLLCAPAMVSANDSLAKLVPAGSRGEATGLLGSALTAGTTLGAPFGGLIIDTLGPAWAYAAAGAVTVLAVLAAVPAYRRDRSARDAPQPAAVPA
jgi:MFS family permease